MPTHLNNDVSGATLPAPATAADVNGCKAIALLNDDSDMYFFTADGAFLCLSEQEMMMGALFNEALFEF